MDHGVGVGTSASSAARSWRSPETHVEAVARRPVAAGQRADLVTGGERGVEQMRPTKPVPPVIASFIAATNALDLRRRFVLRGGAEALDHRVEQRLHAFVDRRGHREDGRAGGLFERLDDLGALLVVEQVGLGQRDHLRFGVEPGAVAVELAADDPPAFDRIARRTVDQVEQHPGALDVAQEAVADAGAFGRALDQAGDVGDDELAALVADHAELRAERGEGIIADLGGGVADRVRKVDLPALGRPTRPTSASNLRRSHSHISSPALPVWCWRGARLVEVL